MGQEIVYCHRCQTRLLGSDFDRGKAFRINQNATCAECAKKILDDLPPAERDAALGKSKGTEVKKGSTGKIPVYKASSDSSHNRIAAITSRQTSSAPRRKSSSSTPLMLGIGAALLIGLILVAAAVSSGPSRPVSKAAPKAPPPSMPPPPAPIQPRTPAPPPPPPRQPAPRPTSPAARLAEARKLLGEARAFAAANPNNLTEQVARFQKAAFAADGTSVSAEAMSALEAAKAKLKGFFSKDLLNLRTKALASANAGDIPAAMTLVDRERKRHAAAEWTREIHRLIREIEPIAEIAYRPLKAKALDLIRNGDRAGADKILNSLKDWRIRRLFDDLDRAIAEAGKSPDATPPTPNRPKPKLDHAVYVDALGSDWKNHSWGADVDFATEKQVHSGSKAISFNPRKAWAGLYLKAKEGISSVAYPALTFAARRGSASIRYRVLLYDEQGAPLSQPVSLNDLGGQPPRDGWKTYTVALSRLGGAGRLVYAVVLQANAASTKPGLYVDDVGFLSKVPAGVDTSPPPPAPATGYLVEWNKAAALAAVRDYDGAAAVLRKAGAEGEKDLADLKAVAALYEEAQKAFARWPEGRNLDAIYADASGVAFRIDEPVRQADGHRAVLRGATVVPFGEILASSLAKIAMRGEDATDARKRTAALFGLFEGDVPADAALLKTLPRKYLDHADRTVRKRVGDKKELAARALLYEAEAEYRGFVTRGAAVGKFKSLLEKHADTDVVKRNRAAIEARTEGGREYFFGLVDLVGGGEFRIQEHEKAPPAWTCRADVAAPSDRLKTYVELEFAAVAGAEYRAWAYVGACCTETFAFNMQATDLAGYEPGASEYAPVDHGVRYLKKTHASHGGGRKQPEKWSWAKIPLPKFASPGPKKVRLLSYQKGFSVAFAMVSARRTTPLRSTEAEELSRERGQAVSESTGSVLSTGSILREVWKGINGSDVSDLTGSPKFKEKPDESGPSAIFEGPPNSGNQYGTRMRGYVHPPETGEYTFWIATDDKGELWLSPDSRPQNKVKIAYVTTAVTNRNWTAQGNQKSKKIRLEKGRRYYVEALQKEGGGDDWIAVGWTLPSGKQERPIPGIRLSPYVVPGSGPVAVQISLPQEGAVFEAGTPVVIQAEVAGAGKSARIEAFQGGRSLGTLRGDPLKLTWRTASPGTYPITIVASERGKKPAVSLPVGIRVGEESFLYRAINLNGSGAFVDGRSWQGRKASSYRTAGWGLERQDVELDPPTDGERAKMVRTSISSAEGTRVTLEGVPAGSYRVYLYAWAPESSGSFDLAVNDTAVASGVRVGSVGSWARLGPWPVEVKEGTIEIAARRGTAHFSGVEVWKLGTPPPAPQNPTRTDLLGGRGGNPFDDAPPDRPLLVGFRVSQGTFTNKPHAKTVQPIYMKDGARRDGEVYGDPSGNVTEILAKPGYAVGAVVGKGSQRVNGFKVVFYRISGNVLNAADSYESPWVGGDWGGPEKRVDGEGAPVVGIHGRRGADTDCFGLIYLK